MLLILVRKLLRDVRWPLLVVCFLLFLFSLLWVRVAWRVTTEIAPYFNLIGGLAGAKQADMEDVVFTGIGKVSQAVIGGSDIHFERPTDFLAVEMLHPVVIVLVFLWSVGRTSGAIAGEIDRGTMELLLSQPVPRDRLILAHLIVDLLLIPLIVLCVIGGTQVGLMTTGKFVENADVIRKVRDKAPPLARAFVTAEPRELPVDTSGQWKAGLNLAGLMFAMSGIGMMISATGSNRWRSTGWAVLLVLTMFVANVIAQLWEPMQWVRPFTLFYYYQPQKLWLNDQWNVDLGEVWNGGRKFIRLPMVLLLFAVGTAGYSWALNKFMKRDLPAPL